MLTSPAAVPTSAAEQVARRTRRRLLACVLALVALAVVVVASLVLGVRDVSLPVVWQALTDPVAGDVDHRVIAGQRVPRALVGLAAGLALGVAGAVIQGVTRNPIADPGLLGLNSGASLAVVCAVWLLGLSAPSQFVWFAFLGAAAAAALVFSIGAGQPVKLALVGATVTALITPMITLVLLRDQQAFNLYRFWAVGSLTGRGLDTLVVVLPFIAVGAVLAAGLAHRLNMLALGDDIARGLGQRVGVTRAVAGLTIVLLAGAATSLAGPIALVGLAVPHAARRLVGTDYRWVLLLSALLGPVMLLGADVIGRLILPHSELEAGVVAAAIGAPVLVAVARGKKVSGV
ncbi:iron chelate uptake ABC transporter family permease subunit [Isoptericola chiayiensis]|uniref:Iron chelate uptake ABC transporter family permease subunit n=1 Tax=Isoptericola chiayiensis TaxID=579446 RepID=A0ABP8YHX2_9MICO|nr:iron chelate uptake ABC transporter family permease subunit [Isoptericola chiayiensis]NOW00332.1 iron complex transport system permease protein [Isoptericola chiayiensis]